VIAVALAGAVVDLVPILRVRAIIVVLTVGAIWAVVVINLRGVKAAGLMARASNSG
jgi:basic amino acid/polyamine antiporter, APA family